MKRFLHRDNLLLLAILTVAALLRFYHLDGSSLWHDEGNTWALIQRGFVQIAYDAAVDIHPPGYYWLLKVWAILFGTSVFAMRSLSTICGVLLIYVVYAIGNVTNRRRHRLPFFALLAAWIAALNPFQVYYSQEARMYALLALESAGLFWALLALQRSERRTENETTPTVRWLTWPLLAYLFFGIAGLWTHYSFPIVLAAAAVSYVVVWLLPPVEASRNDDRSADGRRWQLVRFTLLNLLILVAYLPWLPTAIERVFSWPKGGDAISISDGLLLTAQTLLFGPLSETLQPGWPWLLAAALLPLLGMVALRRTRSVIVLTLWLLAPVVLMFGLGLFSDAFLKFLLVASPAWCLLTAATPHLFERQPRIRAILQALLMAGAIAVAALVLPQYYTDTTTRDNYAGVAAYIDAVGEPDADLVLLDAPGQQEVWSYYDPGVPILAVPETRPADPVDTAQTLAAATATKHRVFALFWATDEADPDGVVESWLDRMAFKGPESWQGNMRFVTYFLPGELACEATAPDALFDDRFRLEAICRPPSSMGIQAGDALSVGLHWRALEETATRYKVSLQLSDVRGQIIAQRDGEPGGGSSPTPMWPVAETVIDNHAVWIPFGTPPGEYQLALTMYDGETGERLPTPTGELWPLGTVAVERPDGLVPATAIPMQHRVEKALGPVTLLGYDVHHKGFAHAPETVVQPGDTVEFVFYWQAPDPLPGNWPADLPLELGIGKQENVWPLAGGAFATGGWHDGELVRASFEMPYMGGDRRPQLTIGGASMRLASLPR